MERSYKRVQLSYPPYWKMISLKSLHVWQKCLHLSKYFQVASFLSRFAIFSQNMTRTPPTNLKNFEQDAYTHSQMEYFHYFFYVFSFLWWICDDTVFTSNVTKLQDNLVMKRLKSSLHALWKFSVDSSNNWRRYILTCSSGRHSFTDWDHAYCAKLFLTEINGEVECFRRFLSLVLMVGDFLQYFSTSQVKSIRLRDWFPTYLFARTSWYVHQN